MKHLHLLFVCAMGASICSAQTPSKDPTKAELALLNPPVTGVFAPSPLGGGSDDCLNAATQDAISGLGNFAVDMSLSTTSAGTNPGCGIMTKDVWFEWTSTVTGTVEVQLCGHASTDVVLAVWSGTGCPVGTPIVCNDDSCGLISYVSFTAASGTQYMIQVGMYNNYAGIVTAMDIGTPPPPPANDDCNTPILLPGPGTYPFDTTNALTGAQGQGATVACGTTSAVQNDLWYTYVATTNGTVTFSTCGLTTTLDDDTKISYYAGAGCPTNPSPIGCDDDACATPTYNTILTFSVACGEVFAIQLGNYGANDNIAGTFSVTESGLSCGPPTVPFCLGDGTGTPCPCLPVPNNGAAGHGCGSQLFPGGAILTSTGVASDETGVSTTDTLVLTATDVPGPTLFIQANGIVSPIAFGDGQLCAGVGIIRLGVVFPGPPTNPPNVASYPGGLTPNEIHLQGIASAGQTKHYQAWYRSVPGVCTAGQNYDLTQGLSIVWGN